jgi:hypothetical protein
MAHFLGDAQLALRRRLAGPGPASGLFRQAGTSSLS